MKVFVFDIKARPEIMFWIQNDQDFQLNNTIRL